MAESGAELHSPHQMDLIPSPGPGPSLETKIWDQTGLGLNPDSATDKLCDLEQVAIPL